MVDTLGQISVIAAVPAALVVAAIVLSLLRGTRRIPRYGAALCFALAIFDVLFAAGFRVAFRDGLGPDVVSSSGLTALRRSFADLSLTVLLVPASLIVLGLVLAWLARRGQRAAPRSVA
jgi:hypothetical protein